MYISDHLKQIVLRSNTNKVKEKETKSTKRKPCPYATTSTTIIVFPMFPPSSYILSHARINAKNVQLFLFGANISPVLSGGHPAMKCIILQYRPDHKCHILTS